MKQIIESISYPCPATYPVANGVVIGEVMKSFFVGVAVGMSNNEFSIVSSIAPAEGGGYAVTFEDGRMLFVKDHPQMEVMYKSLEEETDGDKQNIAESAGV